MRRTLCLLPALALLFAACNPQPQASAPGDQTAAPGDTAATVAAPAGTEAAGAAETAGPTPTVNPTSLAIAQTFKVPVRGSEEALVRIYEFSDFLCPYCGRFARETVKDVEAKYGPDEVAFVFWDFPLSSHGIMSMVATEASHCAEEAKKGQFWVMHDTLFENQSKLEEVPPDDEKAAVDMAVSLGKAVGVDEGQLRECLASGRYRPIVGALQQQAMDRGVEMTPTLVLVSRSLQKNANGEYDYGEPETALGALPMADLDAYIQRSLSRAKGTSVPTPTEPPTPTPGATTAPGATLVPAATATP